MRYKCQECKCLEYDNVYCTVDWVRAGQQHYRHHNKFSIQNQKPCQDCTNNTTDILQRKEILLQKHSFWISSWTVFCKICQKELHIFRNQVSYKKWKLTPNMKNVILYFFLTECKLLVIPNITASSY